MTIPVLEMFPSAQSGVRSSVELPAACTRVNRLLKTKESKNLSSFDGFAPIAVPSSPQLLLIASAPQFLALVFSLSRDDGPEPHLPATYSDAPDATPS